jgi:putative ABC transport system ATP-binding protein
MQGASKTPEIVVSTRDVHKAFARGGVTTPVLCGIDLVVERGSCTLLVGPSGCGKSTLLSILGCMLAPDAGEVTILGHSLGQLRSSALARLRRDAIGFVFQRFHLLKGLSALENVSVPLQVQGTPERIARRRGLELLDAVGLADKVHADARRLSQGQCQRVALARALANDPELILADEPTAALDEASGRQALELMKKLLRDFQKTAIIVTHDARIYEYADRIWQMHAGRLEEVATSRPTQAKLAMVH